MGVALDVKPSSAMRGLIALAFVACAVASSMSTMPLFVWSGHSKVASLGQSVKTALSSNLAGAEIVMVYMLDGVSAHAMADRKAALTNLQGTLKKAQDSAFAGLPVALREPALPAHSMSELRSVK